MTAPRFPSPDPNSNVFLCADCGRPMVFVPVDRTDPPPSLANLCPHEKDQPWTTNATCSCGSDEWTTTEQDHSGWWRPLVIRPGILAQLAPFAPPDPNDRQVWDVSPNNPFKDERYWAYLALHQGITKFVAASEAEALRAWSASWSGHDWRQPRMARPDWIDQS